MSIQIKPAGKAVIAVVLAGAIFGGLYAANKSGKFQTFRESMTLGKVDLADKDVQVGGTATTLAGFPSTTPVSVQGPEIRFAQIPWNALMGLNYAVGGKVTKKGSFFDSLQVNAKVVRVDNFTDQQQLLFDFAAALKKGEPHPKDGVTFVSFMGDASKAFLGPLNIRIQEELGPEYIAEVVGVLGKSYGEDSFWGPERWQTKEGLKGGIAAAYLNDGDHFIGLHYLSDQGVCNNPDPKVYDPNCFNWVAAEDFLDAVAKVVQRQTVTLPIVEKGKKVGRDTTLEIQGYATWTPGDDNGARNVGGLYRIMSTGPGEYANQMPSVLVGIKAWNKRNRAIVENILEGAYKGGNQILTFPKALERGGEIQQEIYDERGWDGAKWAKFYRGFKEKDKSGMEVPLGGSKVFNLAAAAAFMGLADGVSPSTSPYHATFTQIGNIASEVDPKAVPPESAPFDSVVSLGYLKAVLARAEDSETKEVAEITYESASAPTRIAASKDININFATGSAELTEKGRAQLRDLAENLTTNQYRVKVDGFTDNTGNPESNMTLSRDRAEAVKRFLENYAPRTFPSGRVTSEGFGQTQQIAGGLAANRRVTISLY